MRALPETRVGPCSFYQKRMFNCFPGMPPVDGGVEKCVHNALRKRREFVYNQYKQISSNEEVTDYDNVKRSDCRR